MALSDFFRKHARIGAFTAAVVAGAGGGYIGGEVAHDARQPAPESRTLTEVVGDLPAKTDTKRLAALEDFHRRIDEMSADRSIAAGEAEKFATDLRNSWNISEKDYISLSGRFLQEVDRTAAARAGDLTSGAAYHQECQAYAALSYALSFGFGDEEETTEDIAACMKENSDAYGAPEMAGVLAGAGLGGLSVLFPALALYRRRRPGF